MMASRKFSTTARAQVFCLALAAAITIALCGCNIQISSIHTQSPSLQLSIVETEPVVQGSWTAQLSRGGFARNGSFWFSISLQDQDGHTTYGSSWPLDNLSPFVLDASSEWPGAFDYSVPAGTFHFRGERSGTKASGTFTFTSNADYAKRAAQHLISAPSNTELLRLALAHVTADEIAAFASGGARLNASDICRLKAHGVTSEFFNDVRKAGSFSVDEVVKLRSYGVPSEFPLKLHAAGYHFDANDLTHLRSYGVSWNDAVAWKESGFDFDAKQLAKLRSYGVSPGFGKAVRSVLGTVDPEGLIRLRTYGVSEAYLSEMRKANGKFTVDELVELRTYGVPADYVAEWRKAGFAFQAKDLIKLRTYGVPSDYALALNTPNRKPLSAETIVRMRQRGLSAQEIRELRE